MVRPPRPLVGCCLVLVGLLLAGCGGEGEGGSTSEWTIAEGALMLERDLLTGDDEDFYFGSINDLAVREDGRIYVAEREARRDYPTAE